MMGSFVRETWVFGALFALPILSLELIHWAVSGSLEGFLIPGWATMPAVAFATASLLWWLLVVLPKSRNLLLGSLTGVVSAAITLAVPTCHAIVMSLRPRPTDDGLGDAVGLYALVVYWAIGLVLGAVLGAVVMVVRRVNAQNVNKVTVAG